MRDTRSIWAQTVQIPPRRPLDRDMAVEVAVLGAGMAGVLVAKRLKRRGVRAVVLEADRIGGGQTQNTTAKITSQHGMCYDARIRRFGFERARHYAQANDLAIREYARMVDERNIDCDFRYAPAYLYATSDAEPLKREADAAAQLGTDARFVSEMALPFPVAGAVRFNRQAQFHPLKFLRAVSDDLEIYEYTRALHVEDNRIETPHHTVRAEKIVFATHYPFVNVPGFYFMRMHQERSYVLALESAWTPAGMLYGTDADGLSFREADGLLLVGGENHRTGENSAGGRYDRLFERVQALVPDVREVARWSAQDCMTLDGAPYIGAFAKSTPNWYVTTGFGKWGMTGAMVGAMCVADAICGQAPDWADAFAPTRFEPSASMVNLATETAQSFKGLTRQNFAAPKETIDALPNGHGGIVAVDGHKIGVYKDADGTAFAVNPRCPHLGCQLAWNPDELSWDCPCHGSRFRYDGTLIDNPTEEGIL